MAKKAKCPQVTFEFVVSCDNVTDTLDEDLVLDISITFLDRPPGWESDSTTVRVEIPGDIIFENPATQVADIAASVINDHLEGTGVTAEAEGGGHLPRKGHRAGEAVARIVLKCVKGVDLRWTYPKMVGWWWSEPGHRRPPPPGPIPTGEPSRDWEDPSGINVGPQNPLWYIGGRNRRTVRLKRKMPVIGPGNPLGEIGGPGGPPVVPETDNPLPKEPWPPIVNPKKKPMTKKPRFKSYPDEPPEGRKPDEKYTLVLGVYVEGNGNLGFPGPDLGWILVAYELDADLGQQEMGELVAEHWNSARILPPGFEHSAISSMMIGYETPDGLSPSPMHWDLSLDPPAFVSLPEGVDQDHVLEAHRSRLSALRPGVRPFHAPELRLPWDVKQPDRTARREVGASREQRHEPHVTEPSHEILEG